MNLFNQKGAALYVVLWFAIITFIGSTAYVLTQYPAARAMRKHPARLHALVNARTGVWYALTLLDKKEAPARDTTLAEKDALFGEDMFKAGFGEEADDSTGDSAALELTADGPPVRILPFDTALADTILLSLVPSTYFRIVKSKGLFRQEAATVLATVGSRIFNSPDTVVFLNTPGMPDGPGFIDGKIAFLTQSIDSSDSTMRKRFAINDKELQKIIEDHKPAPLKDTNFIQGPLLIKENDELSTIPDTIFGPLFIDGTMHDIEWNQRRVVYVLEELQITGTVHIENCVFITGKDIKLLDKTFLRSVELYTTARIFFGGETRFSGNAMAKGDVEIYDNASIENKSIIISTGGANQKPAPPGPPGVTPPNPVNNPNDIKTFSIYVRDRALVDGILIALDNLAGIKVETEAFVKGILWSEKSRVAVTGKVHGIVKAFVLVDEQDAVNVARNVITGTIKELPTIGEYYLPYFFGNSSLIRWKEE